MAKSQPRRKVIPDSAKTKEIDAAEIVEKTSGDKISLANKDESEFEKVTTVVPKAFKLTRDDGSVHEYHPGTQEMPVDDAAHWFARAMGVKVYAPD